MKKKLILVAAPPASGKTFVSERLCGMFPMVYLDKDDLAPLLCAAFTAAGQEMNMDGDFYKENLRSAEYETLLHLAFSTLRFEDRVLVNAPFGKEMRDADLIKNLKKRANEQDAALILIWVCTPKEICFERMKQRNADRDALKLQDWDDYAKNINYEPPCELKKAVDQWILFDAKDTASTEASFRIAYEIIKEKSE